MIRELLGPVDFAKAKRHEILLKGNQGLARTLENCHPDLKLPPDLQQVWDALRNPGDCLDYDKYLLLATLGLTTEQEESSPVDPIMDLNEALKKRFPLLDHPHAETKHLQRYIDLENNRD